jgi:formylglycine-generating enzyme required for sulfatase activity/predicted Ser/Thr protein kinase
MGTVYEAMDERVSAIVALKEANVVTDDASRSEFEREARLLANLRHPSLPKVMDYFIEGGGEYLVMEFIPGYDLAELLKRRGSPFHPKLVLRWADNLLNLLEYLHGLDPSILHRDIKPANLKLTQREEIYLLDFGLAKGKAGQMTTQLTSRSVHGYTPVYAPLEQILGQGTDSRSDLYSLGATLYHLLTGVLPTDAPTRDEEVEEGKPDPLKPIHELNPKVPPGIAAVIYQAMAIRRKNRPESAAMMHSALKQAEETAERDEIEHGGQESVKDARRVDQISPAVVLPTTPVMGGQPTAAEKPNVTLPSERGAGYDARANAPVSWGGAGAMPSVPQPAASARMAQLPDRPSNQWKRILLIATAVIAVVALILVVVSLTRRNGQRKQLGSEEVSQAVPPASASKTPKPLEGVPAYSENINGTPLEMIKVPEGTFTMGSDDFESGRGEDEGPQHRVAVQSFYIGKFEVTQEQWKAVMGNNPSRFKGNDHPVENVSWDDAVEFCRRLSKMTGREYRLPSEAEWEYACRAGSDDSSAENLDDAAWYDANSQNATHTVGQKQSNAFGLYDMRGNVWEWCMDVYHDSYTDAPSDGSVWLNGGEQKSRVARGGAWQSAAEGVRPAVRSRYSTDYHVAFIGFRVALSNQ